MSAIAAAVGVGGVGGGGGDHELMVGPVAEALGVSRSWLLERDTQLSETVDLPVSLLVELLNAADCLYNSEQERHQKVQHWLSRISGRPLCEFDSCVPLLLALRRQFRLTRDEDLSDVTVWRRREARPSLSKAQVEITIRPDNGSRLKKLARQLGSPEAAVEFLLQMEEHCGKSGSQPRTRWPPKIHYESARGQLKIDVGTELVCVVLSQFKPDTPAGAAAVAAATAAAPAAVTATATSAAVAAASPHYETVTAPAAGAAAGAATGGGGGGASLQIESKHTASSLATQSSNVVAGSQLIDTSRPVNAVLSVENGHVSSAHTSSHIQHQPPLPPNQQQQHVAPSAAAAAAAEVPRLPPAAALAALPSSSSNFQTVELDATLPAQMFADDDCGDSGAALLELSVEEEEDGEESGEGTGTAAAAAVADIGVDCGVGAGGDFVGQSPSTPLSSTAGGDGGAAAVADAGGSGGAGGDLAPVGGGGDVVAVVGDDVVAAADSLDTSAYRQPAVEHVAEKAVTAVADSDETAGSVQVTTAVSQSHSAACDTQAPVSTSVTTIETAATATTSDVVGESTGQIVPEQVDVPLPAANDDADATSCDGRPADAGAHEELPAAETECGEESAALTDNGGGVAARAHSGVEKKSPDTGSRSSVPATQTEHVSVSGAECRATAVDSVQTPSLTAEAMTVDTEGVVDSAPDADVVMSEPK